MYSSLIGKVEKAQRYALERERLSLSNFKASFRGEHDSYQVTYDGGAWKCSCEHFDGRQLCSHAMAIERILDGMMLQPAGATG
ncbi:MAG: SWIM zinc finger family protein [Chloroflexota bacterium]|mgnify:FL=1